MVRKSRKRKRAYAVNVRNRFKPPGDISQAPEARASQWQIIAYGAGDVYRESQPSLQRIRELHSRYPKLWLNVDGLGDTNFLTGLGEIFQLHPLALEDTVNQHQLAKCEDYGDSIFFVSRMLNAEPQLESEQLAMFFGKTFVITIQEIPGDCFQPIRDRLLKNSGRLVTGSTDFLAYSLLDSIVDSYFPIVDQLADRLDEIEDVIGQRPSQSLLRQLHAIRNDLLIIRRAIRPLRDAVNQLIRESTDLIDHETRLYLRDCFDHCQQLMDLVETYRDLCSDMRDYHLSMISFRMNEIMKVLTIIATIFIPLSFVASVYGMNFDTEHPWNMPELGWPYGYFFALGLMLAVAIGFILFFWRKGWIFAADMGHDDRTDKS